MRHEDPPRCGSDRGAARAEGALSLALECVLCGGCFRPSRLRSLRLASGSAGVEHGAVRMELVELYLWQMARTFLAASKTL